MKKFSKIFSTVSIGILVFITIPLVFGLVVILINSFGITPIWSHSQFSLLYWQKMFADTVFLKSLLAATIRGNSVGFLLFIFIFCIGFFIVQNKSTFLKKLNSFCMTMPHIVLAVGLAFLIAPSGFLFRIIAIVFHIDTFSNIVTVNDPYGISMSIAVFIKSMPFVLFSLFGVLTDYTVVSHITQARLLRHNNFVIWTCVVFPQTMSKIILPFFIALAYAISPIDIAAIIGPYTPSSVGTIITNWFLQPDREIFIYANIGCLLHDIGMYCISCFVVWLVCTGSCSTETSIYITTKYYQCRKAGIHIGSNVICSDKSCYFYIACAYSHVEWGKTVDISASHS